MGDEHAKKNFNTPDETKTLPKTKLEVVTVGNGTFTRTTFEPGWKWSEHVGPAVERVAARFTTYYAY